MRNARCNALALLGLLVSMVSGATPAVHSAGGIDGVAGPLSSTTAPYHVSEADPGVAGGSGIVALTGIIFINGFEIDAIQASINSLTMGESRSSTFGVRLAFQPTGDITVSIASLDPGAVTVTPAMLIFTPGNFANFQTVTASGVSDSDAEDEAVSIRLTSPGVSDKLITANVTDDDIAVGAGPFPLPGEDPAIEVDAVGRNGGGDLVRDTTAFANRFLWISNQREGTVSKISVVNGAEVARYATVTHDAMRVVNHAGRNFPVWNGNANGDANADNQPQYTAVDYAGNAWVGNPAYGFQSSLTKILGNPATCPDLNGNGQVDTSRNVNATPGIQITDPAEFLGEADECIAMTVVVGNLVSGAAGVRALAIDANRSGAGSDAGNPWVGVFNESAFYQLHGATGAILQRVATPGVQPFSAAIDSLGRLWARDSCCGTTGFGRINALQNPAPYTAIPGVPAFQGLGLGNYGIAVDAGNRVWIAGHPYGGLMRYEPGSNTWAQGSITGSASNGNARGVALDGRGNAWTSFHPGGADGLVARFVADTTVLTGVYQMDDSGSGTLANIPVGVGVDFAGDVWTSNQATSNVSRLHIDSATGNPAPHPVTGDTVDVFPVGPGPYVHADFTGLGYRRVTRPDGEYRVRLAPCPGAGVSRWLTAEWAATTPATTRVELWLRSSNDPATLAQAPLQGPWTTSPANLQATPGPVPDRIHLQFTLRLVSEDPAVSATVQSYALTRTCPP